MLEFAQEAAEGSAAPLPEPVWARIARHPQRVLMLDFDGTLAPLVPDRTTVALPPASFAALRRIASRPMNRVAVISGRPLAELAGHLGGLPVHLVGEHGWEERTPLGLTWTHRPGWWVRQRLGLAAWLAAAAGHAAQLERKRTAVVLHTRAPAPGGKALPAGAVPRLWKLLTLRGGLGLDAIDGGWELRATARGKHTAALGLLRAAPPDTLAVFLGDDVSDEDAFRVLRPTGVTIRVGGAERSSAAEWRLGGPAEVAAFLSRWAELGEGAR